MNRTQHLANVHYGQRFTGNPPPRTRAGLLDAIA